jgi:hypothetical protein
LRTNWDESKKAMSRPYTARAWLHDGFANYFRFWSLIAIGFGDSLADSEK